MRALIEITVDTVNLLLVALLVGALFGLWLSFDPSGLDALAYILQQQHGIRTLNIVMPVLGLSTLLLTMTAAGLAYRGSARFVPLAVAVLCLLGAGLVTRFLNQPINAVVMTWSAASPPADWTSLTG